MPSLPSSPFSGPSSAPLIPPSPLVGATHAPSGHELDRLESARADKEGLAGAAAGGKRPLKIAICTENFLPKIDGVTRTLAMLLEHLQAEGHEALVMGPATPLTSYAGAEVVATKGIPLLGVYKGLGLNFLRPRFIRKIREFSPDVCMFIDPIFLGGQTILAVQHYFPDLPLVSSYHTNLAMYASLFGFSWLTPPMWAIQRNLHGRCNLSFCPSPSTARMLADQGFENVRLWPRGVDVDLFRPSARDFALRQTWGAEPLDLDEDRPSPRIQASDTARRSSSFDDLPPLHLPPPYSAQPAPTATTAFSSSKVVVLYVGRISWEKNLRLLIEAFRGLQQPDEATGRPACQLVFVGDGPARGEAESLCQGYGLDALFLGFRKGQELAAAYASADVFAFPSFTETFGQVVSEAQASGLPVIGLKAEGVSDLVEHRKTGLLLDLNELVRLRPADSSTPPPYSTATSPESAIPTDPHSLFALGTPSFASAVTLYRNILLESVSDHDLRRQMGSAAHLAASKRSWWGAMEMLVDGFRELSAARAAKAVSKERASSLSLSRTSTIEVDVVCGQPEEVEPEKAEGASTATTSPKRRRLLRLNGVLRRTGGRLPDSSVSLQPLRSWLAPQAAATVEGGEGVALLQEAKGSGQSLAVRLAEVAVFFLFLYFAVTFSSRFEIPSLLRSLQV
ncbi:hypothetical protein JCM6882_003972 [Rhodosporidiobolus microsporus]